MTGHELITAMQPYVDKNNMIKPVADWTDSGNGLVYSAVFIVLMNELAPDLVDHIWFENIVRDCTVEPGLLKRTPDGSYGLDSWDDYIAVAVVMIIIGNRKIPRQILWHGFRHLGFYNNTSQFAWKAWLWRFPQLWLMMWPAAFPILKYPLAPVIALVCMWYCRTKTDASGAQLEWLFLNGANQLGLIRLTDKSFIAPEFADYYGANMPFTLVAQQFTPEKK